MNQQPETQSIPEETGASRRKGRSKSRRKAPKKSRVVKENLLWFLRELAKVVHSPIGVAGGFLEAVRGWKFSRNWMSVWLNLPATLLVASVFAVYGFSRMRTTDGQLQQTLVQSEEKCSTSTLEASCNQIDEAEFTQSVGVPNSDLPKDGAVFLSDLTKKYVELLSKKVLDIEVDDFRARYRLAMIHFISGQKELKEKSFDEMQSLASLSAGKFPQADAWLARRKISEFGERLDTSSNLNKLTELKKQLDVAFEWKSLDYRMLIAYAKVLERTGDLQRAVVATKRAAGVLPDANLYLARLYAKIGNQEGLRESAYLVEDFYGKRLNTSLEKESDRLAVAEVKRLSKKLDASIAVLQEGLLNNRASPAIKRELSEVYRQVYQGTIQEINNSSGTEKKKWKVDLEALAKVSDSDPTNPNFSLEIARLIPLEVTPTKKLLDALKKQMQDGITTSSTYVLLAEGYYQIKKVKEAIRYWELAIKKEPNDWMAVNNLALVLAKHQPDQLPRSFELLNRVIEANPSNPEFYDSLGELLLAANRPKEAINKLEKAVRLNQNRINTREMLVTAYRAAGMEDMAQAQLKVLDTLKSSKEKAEPDVGPGDKE